MTSITKTDIFESDLEGLRSMVNDGEGILLRDSLNVETCEDMRRWDEHMERTRRAFGHDKPGHRTRDKATGELILPRYPLMFQQTFSFRSDECDIGGGKLTPEDCMAYAKEYAEEYYPNHEVVFAVQRVSDDSGAHYTAYIIVNRTNLKTGHRLSEGRDDIVCTIYAKRLRELDKRWGLEVRRQYQSFRERVMQAREEAEKANDARGKRKN